MGTEALIGELRLMMEKSLARPLRRQFYLNLINHLEEQERKLAAHSS